MKEDEVTILKMRLEILETIVKTLLISSGGWETEEQKKVFNRNTKWLREAAREAMTIEAEEGFDVS